MPVLAFWMFCFKRHWNGSLLTYIIGDRLILLLRCSYLMIRLIAVMFSVKGRWSGIRNFGFSFPQLLLLLLLLFCFALTKGH